MAVVPGFGSVISSPASTDIVMEEGDNLGMGLVFGLFNATINLGFAITPFRGKFIMDTQGIHSVFYFAGLIGIAGAFISYCSLKPR